MDLAVEELLKSASRNDLWMNGAIHTLGREIFVNCGDGTRLQLEAVQMEGRNRVTAREFAFGVRLSTGERFGS